MSKVKILNYIINKKQIQTNNCSKEDILLALKELDDGDIMYGCFQQQ